MILRCPTVATRWHLFAVPGVLCDCGARHGTRASAATAATRASRLTPPWLTVRGLDSQPAFAIYFWTYDTMKTWFEKDQAACTGVPVHELPMLSSWKLMVRGVGGAAARATVRASC